MILYSSPYFKHFFHLLITNISIILIFIFWTVLNAPITISWSCMVILCSIISFGGFFSLCVQRVYCKHCHSTYAILPSFVVPYSRSPLSAFAQILDPGAGIESVSILWQISLKSIRHIRYQFRLYRKMLLPHNWLDFSFSSIVFSLTARQFFQNRYLFLSLPT